LLAKFFEWKKVRTVIQYAAYMLLAAFLQSLLFPSISIMGTSGFLLPAAVVAAGMQLGGVKGAVFGAVLGLLSDLSFPDTTVLYTLLFPAIGLVTGYAAEFYINRGLFSYIVFSSAALLVTGFMQLLLAVIIHGAGLLPALITVFMQLLVTLIPSLLLYIPFASESPRKDTR